MKNFLKKKKKKTLIELITELFHCCKILILLCNDFFPIDTNQNQGE